MKVYTTSEPRFVNMTLEQLFRALNSYAFINAHNSTDNDTWYAKATMRIKTKGAIFTVDSGFNHVTLHSALSTLLELVENAVREMEQATYTK